MRVDGVLAWWSPDPRGILPLERFHVSRSLRRVRDRFEIRIDTAFEAVMRACADPRRPHGWIDESFVAAYCRLHALGRAHSIEAWNDGRARRAACTACVSARLFAGESMFHRVTNASKVALWAAVELLRMDGASCSTCNGRHRTCESLGAIDVSRARYLDLLAAAVASES